MTQDVRIARVVESLSRARQSLFMATQLLYADGNVDAPVARFPTNMELATITEELEQVLKLSNKIARYIDVGPTCPECHRVRAAKAPFQATCGSFHVG